MKKKLSKSMLKKIKKRSKRRKRKREDIVVILMKVRKAEIITKRIKGEREVDPEITKREKMKIVRSQEMIEIINIEEIQEIKKIVDKEEIDPDHEQKKNILTLIKSKIKFS